MTGLDPAQRYYFAARDQLPVDVCRQNAIHTDWGQELNALAPLSETLTLGSDTYCRGWLMYDQLSLANTGDEVWTNIVVRQTLPPDVMTAADTEVGSDSAATSDPRLPGLVWHVAELAAGETVVLQSKLRTFTNYREPLVSVFSLTSDQIRIPEVITGTRTMNTAGICDQPPPPTPTDEPSGRIYLPLVAALIHLP